MNPIQIRLLCGAATGRVRQFDEPQLSFGRTPDNTIVTESPHASRQHGALVFDDGGWHVLNASPNGTTINGKAVGKKKIVLKTGDVIGVANNPLFSVEILPDPADDAPPPPPFSEPATAAAAPFASSAFGTQQQPLPSKQAGGQSNKLWYGLGAYFALMILVFLVLLMVRNGHNSSVAQSAPLTRQQIADAIARPISLPKNERLARENLQQARELYQRVDTNPTAPYEAYIHYKRADAYSGGEVFKDGLVYREFKKCEEDLTNRVADTYAEGYTQLGAGRWQQAAATFQLLLRMYPDTQSVIFLNVTHQLAAARAHRNH